MPVTRWSPVARILLWPWPETTGTSCEISYGLVYKKPVIDLGGWDRKGMIKAKNLKEAEATIKKLIREISEE